MNRMKHEWFPVTLSFVLTHPSDRFNLSVCLSVCLFGTFNREAEMFIPRGPVAGSIQHTLWPRRRASDATILVSRAFAFVFSWYQVVLVLGSSSTYSPHINHSGRDSLTKMFSSSSKISVRTWGSLEQKQQYQSSQYKIQTADRVENAA